MGKIFGAIGGIFTSGFGLLKLKKYIGMIWTLYRNKKEITQAIGALNDVYREGLDLYNVTTSALKDKKITDAEKDAIIKEAREFAGSFKAAYEEGEDVLDIIKGLVK